MDLMREALGTPSLEDIANGKTTTEIEHTYYGRLANFDDLKKASSMEHQEQWEIKLPKTPANATKGSIRIRKTIEHEKLAKYVLTTKTVANSHGDKFETSEPSTEEMFKQFRMMSESGMMKDRYMFPVVGTDLIWEFDLFISHTDEEGRHHYSPWIKIDLEVKDRSIAVPQLPIEVTDLITAPFGERTDVEEKKVTELYDNIFRMRNPHIKVPQ